MKSLSEFWQSARELAPLRSRKLKPKQKQLLKIGCVALAMSLTLGAVPFLKGHASEADDTVTRSDLVESITDPEAITDPDAITVPAENADPADDDSDDSEFNVLFDEVEPILTGAETPFVTRTIQATYSNGVLTLGGSGTLTSTDYSNVKNHFGISEIDIRTLNIGGDISTITDYCFYNQLGVNGANISINIGDSVEVIRNYAFCNGWAINNLSLGSGVQKIGDHAFYGCSALSSVVIPDNVTSIDSYAFDSCFSLNTVTIGRNVRSIGYKAFYQTSLGNVEFKTGTITSYGTSVFGVQDGNYHLDIELPCEHFSIGGVIVNDTNKSHYFGDDNHVDLSANPSIIQTVLKVEATCTEDGCEKHWECSGCGKCFSDSAGTNEVHPESLVIPALGHNPISHAPVAATCTKAGNIQYWSCSRCNKYFSDAACTQETTQSAVAIPALGHNLTRHAPVAATCTTDGNIEYWECSDCGDLFSDENGTNGITQADTVIPAHHTLVHHDAVAATCTEPGNIEYWSCNVCGGLFGDENGTTVLESKDITINTTDHEYAWHTYRNDDGTFFDRKICVNCNDLFDEGHFKYALDEDKSGKEWTTGSDQDLFVKIINIANNPGYSKGDDPMIGRLTAVSVDGTQLVKDTEYTASAGSIDIHILPGYLKNLSVGKHTVTVEVSYTFVTLLPDGSEIDDTVALSFNHEFTVVKPSSVPSPGTGESSFPIAVSLALMLIAAYGAVYSFARRKTTKMQTSEAE